MKLRSKMTYSNVVATLAVLIAAATGTVYAAAHLGKNAVHSRNIAPGAVKTSDLGKNAVTSPKIKNGTVNAVDVAPGVLPNDIADLTGTATGGPKTGLNTAGVEPVPLNGTTTFTPQAGRVSAVGIEAQFTNAKSASATNDCSPSMRLLINGQDSRANANPNSTASSTPVTVTAHSADGPIGLTNPGTPVTISVDTVGDPDCSADTRLDKVVVRIAQIH
jgi:hypothetical protein